jgi:hypothetical protein
MTLTNWQSIANTSVRSSSGEVGGTLNGALDGNDSTYISSIGALGILKIRITFPYPIVLSISSATYFRLGAVGANCSYDAELLNTEETVIDSVVGGPRSVSSDPAISYPFSSGGYLAGVRYCDITLNAPDAGTALKLYTANFRGLSAPDIKYRFEHSGTMYAIAAEVLNNHKFRTKTEEGIFGIALVATGDADASPFRCFDGVSIKSLCKLPLET